MWSTMMKTPHADCNLFVKTSDRQLYALKTGARNNTQADAGKYCQDTSINKNK